MVDRNFLPSLRFSGKLRQRPNQDCKMPVPRPRLAALLLAATAPSVAPAADTAGSVDIGGSRKMYVECRGAGAPAVVIVAGGKAAADDWTEAAAPGTPNVFDAIGAFTQLCAYDRPVRRSARR